MKRQLDPPKLAARAISWLAPANDAPELLGDLQERFADKFEQRGRILAQLWYWGQAVALTIGLTRYRLRRISLPRGMGCDLRLAVRSLVRSPALSAAGMVALGIGIGGPSTLFAIVDGIYRPLPVREPEKVVSISLRDLAQGRRLPIGDEIYQAWRQGGSGLESLGAYWPEESGVSGGQAGPQRCSSAYATAAVFRILDARPIAGRLFTPSDMLAGALPTALIREDLWEQRFGRSRQAIGSTLRINGLHHTIVGVLPAAFAFPEDQQLWMPLNSVPYQRPLALHLLGRLGSRATDSIVEQQLLSIAGRLPRPAGSKAALQVEVEEFVMAQMGGSTYRMLQTVIGIVCILVLIAAVNVSSLLLARGASRSREAALRMAIGASRLRVSAQLMTESLLLAAGGALLGILIAFWGLAWVRSIVEESANQMYWIRLELSPSAVGFALILAGLAALAAVLAPALRSCRVDLSEAIKADGLPSASRPMGSLVPAIVGLEAALSCTLLIVSGLIVLGALENIRPASEFPIQDVLTARLVLEDYDYPDEASRRAFAGRLAQLLERQPRLDGCALMTALPGEEAGQASLQVADRSGGLQADELVAQVRQVSPSFFELFDLQPTHGRLLEEGDRQGRPAVAVVNEAFVEEHLEGGSALGRTIRLSSDGSGPVAEIVGVVADRGVTSDDGRPAAGLFLPLAQGTPEVIWVALRTPSARQSGLPVLVEAVKRIDAGLPLGRIRTLAEVKSRQDAEERLFGILFGAFGLAALLLAAVGLHGVVAFSVTQRTREIGIRRALGAPSRRVFWNTLGRGVMPAALGVACGVGLAWLLAPLLGEALYGIDPRDPRIFALVPAGLLAACLVSALAPAKRASRLDPIAVLRSE